MPKYEFVFNSIIETKKELEEEIVLLLWKIKYTWANDLDHPDIKWIRSKTDESWIKIKGGYKKQCLQKVINNVTIKPK